MKIGLIGQGLLHDQLSGRLCHLGNEVLTHRGSVGGDGGESLHDFVEQLPVPRIIFVTDPECELPGDFIHGMLAILAAGDLVLDATQSDHQQSKRNANSFYDLLVGYMDFWIDGDLSERSSQIFVSGFDDYFEMVFPLLDAISNEGNVVHLSTKAGAGHYARDTLEAMNAEILKLYQGAAYELSNSDFEMDPSLVKSLFRNVDSKPRFGRDLMAGGSSVEA
ncbi:hypothetical protein [Acidithrix sp. C25]|uniref:hypothetical protein n=1 Tax=Acidithrix sp. C25 TaxID=1671482 RepID=UPI00191BAD61|nr:hypothetical protein [Acidithrix sp. C25]CAG4913467.1 unnamed protein product [Acidithrix sp. C25]